MAALDRDGKPLAVPGLVLETDEDRRRCDVATKRAAKRQRPKDWRAGARDAGETTGAPQFGIY